MYAAPLKYRMTPPVFLSSAPRPLMSVTSGYVFGSHMTIIGDLSFSAKTAVVGNLSESWTASSVET